MFKRSILVASASVFMCLITGCVRKPEPVPPVTQFLAIPQINRQVSFVGLPFQYTWAAPDFQIQRYSKIAVVPVNTAFVPLTNWEEKKNFLIKDEGDYEKEIDDLASYTTQKIIDALRTNAKGRFEIVRYAEPGALILEVAIIDAVIGTPVVKNEASNPQPGNLETARASLRPSTPIGKSAETAPNIRYEVKIRDGATYRVLALGSDQEFPTARVVGPLHVARMSSFRETSALWAQMLAESLATGKLQRAELTPRQPANQSGRV